MSQDATYEILRDLDAGISDVCRFLRAGVCGPRTSFPCRGQPDWRRG